MNRTVRPGSRSGAAWAPASKSMAHRYLICAALSEKESRITCDTISEDIEATIDCLNALGAEITIEENREIRVKPVVKGNGFEDEAKLACRQSGSTLRFLLPVVGALGKKAVFYREGNLASRPMTAFTGQLAAHGMTIEEDGDLLRCGGKLQPGVFEIPGNISSQFISGLLMALPLLEGDSMIRITGELQSGDYIAMTEEAAALSGVFSEQNSTGYRVPGGQKFAFPERYTVEADWSGAAFLLCMGALSEKGVEVKGLKMDSRQGDRRILEILKEFGARVEIGEESVRVRKGRLDGITVDASNIPDLIPTVCAAASYAEGETRIINAGRLRMKETDRIVSITEMLSALGAGIRESGDTMIIKGRDFLEGGETGSFGDHRIAMAAAVAACGCKKAVTVKEAECVSKSFPDFWDVFDALEVG